MIEIRDFFLDTHQFVVLSKSEVDIDSHLHMS